MCRVCTLLQTKCSKFYEEICLTKTIIKSHFRAFGNHYEEVKVIDRSYVPIIKLIDKATRFHIDISFNTHVAVLQTVNWVESTKRNVPQLEPLVLVLKQFLTQRDLNHPFNGGLSSYALILMTYSFIKVGWIKANQEYKKKFSPEKWLFRRTSTTLHWVFFCTLFSGSMDTNSIMHKLQFAFVENIPFLFLRSNWHTKWTRIHTLLFFLLKIRFKHVRFTFQKTIRYRVLGNNVGKGAHNMMAIKSAFAEAYDLIFSGIMQCYVFDRTFIQTCYCGPMLSLVISFTEEEINYRILLRNEIICNNTKVCRWKASQYFLYIF